MSLNRRSFLAGAVALTAAAPAGAIAFSKPSSTDEIVKRLKRHKYIKNETLYLDKTLGMPDGSALMNCLIRNAKDFKGSSLIYAPLNSKMVLTNCMLEYRDYSLV